MNYIYILFGVLIAFYIYGTQKIISDLRLNNENLSTNLSLAKQANNAYKDSLEELRQDYIKGLETLSAIKNEKEKEVRYVTTIKEKIIRDNNSTCIDAINAIYGRLRETRDADNNASK
ncbi:hypothetical protein [Campylobacter hyointestinalis]|uniref:Uncharacterized protein n=1 Tax=Campylobacter hyointestinalis subsp. hyointestinalis TaxID=91352 RepID=A0A9W5AMD9_CAMHY|nr:hypothetical protein [Campylobacter hyointestinalis]CUU74403.1 Uncharacterised protein [Campylobacter hyointestinalis subsp. hyointestinalis]CUU82199.1 Uncharacterised protein [Campylobacter hyointestinalis subsp. hyointestinalis]